MFILSKARFDAAIFDLDGVITQSARIHAKAWKEMFDTFLTKYNQPPFDLKSDYRAYIDGKPRYEGVKSFLESREIDLPFGSADDSPTKETICGLGNQKNTFFLKFLDQEGVDVFETSVALLQQLRALGFKCAVVSSSKNCTAILKKAGLHDLFEVQVDGVVAEQLKLKGKPQPDIFLHAANILHVKPKRAVVFEDAQAGVEAGHKGHFFVIGVDRTGRPEELIRMGADVVVSDLAEVKGAE